jgi:hypothetical protein
MVPPTGCFDFRHSGSEQNGITVDVIRSDHSQINNGYKVHKK